MEYMDWKDIKLLGSKWSVTSWTFERAESLGCVFKSKMEDRMTDILE